MKKINRDRTYILESMPVGKAIKILAIPTMLAMVVQVIYNMTDTFFIGKLNDANMVAAISIAMPIFMLLQVFGNIFSIGGSSVISRLLGQNDYENANKSGSISFWSALIVCVTIAIVTFIFKDGILKICGASSNTIGYAKEYLTIIAIGSPLIGLQMTMSGLLRSEGATKESMIGMILGTGLNIALDPVFILVFDMGVAGAAWATIIGYSIGFLYFLSYFLRKHGSISISPKNFSFSKKLYSEILKIGLPASIGMLLMSIGFAIGNVFAASFGDKVVAANGVVMRVTSIAIMLTIGLAQGCQPLMGYSYGAGNKERLMSIVKKSAVAGTILCTIIALFFALFTETFITVFIKDREVVSLGARILKVFVISIPFTGVQMILMTMFQALGRAGESLIISLGRQGIFYLPFLMVFSNLWGFDGFIYAQPMASVATTILSSILFISTRKKILLEKNEVLKEPLLDTNIKR